MLTIANNTKFAEDNPNVSLKLGNGRANSVNTNETPARLSQQVKNDKSFKALSRMIEADKQKYDQRLSKLNKTNSYRGS